jgi:hypothetical protein
MTRHLPNTLRLAAAGDGFKAGVTRAARFAEGLLGGDV